MSLLVPVHNSSCPLHQEDRGGNAKKHIERIQFFPWSREKHVILSEGILGWTVIYFSQKVRMFYFFKCKLYVALTNNPSELWIVELTQVPQSTSESMNHHYWFKIHTLTHIYSSLALGLNFYESYGFLSHKWTTKSKKLMNKEGISMANGDSMLAIILGQNISWITWKWVTWTYNTFGLVNSSLEWRIHIELTQL